MSPQASKKSYLPRQSKARGPGSSPCGRNKASFTVIPAMKSCVAARPKRGLVLLSNTMGCAARSFDNPGLPRARTACPLSRRGDQPGSAFMSNRRTIICPARRPRARGSVFGRGASGARRKTAAPAMIGAKRDFTLKAKLSRIAAHEHELAVPVPASPWSRRFRGRDRSGARIVRCPPISISTN